MRNINSVYRLIPAAFFSMILLGCETAPPTIQTGPDAQLSFDGLHRVDNSQADAAWARPDFDISGFTKIMLVGAGVSYRDVSGGRAITHRPSDPQYIDENTRAQFEQVVGEVFLAEMSNIERFEIVDEAGPEVLTIKAGLIDVVSFVPPDRPGSRSVIVQSSLGEATLVLELQDSMTNTVLARSVDRRAAENFGAARVRSGQVATSSQVREVIRFSARRLHEGLDGFGQQASSSEFCA